MPNNNNQAECDLCGAETSVNENDLCATCQVDEDAAKRRFEMEQAASAIVKNITTPGVHPNDPDEVERRSKVIKACRSLVRRGFSIC